jgi:hypothetical protein
MKQDRIVDRVVREVKVGGRGKAKSKSTALTTEAQRSQRLHGETGVDGGPAVAKALARQGKARKGKERKGQRLPT